MGVRQRHEALVLLMAQNGYLTVKDLAQRLGVSEMTVRRDLQALQMEGLAQRMPGGGQVAGTAAEPSFMAKRLLQREQKEAIARTARTLVEPRMTIGLTAGTTTWMLAKWLRAVPGLTVVTNSTNVALEFGQGYGGDIILTGGQFRTPSDALVGPLAEASARVLHTDLVFVGVHGLSVDAGLTTPNILEASINRVLIEGSDRVVVVCDSTKWGVRALAQTAGIGMVDLVVSDSDMEPWQSALEDAGVDVLLAKARGDSEGESDMRG